MDAHAAVRTFYGFFHNDSNTCNLMSAALAAEPKADRSYAKEHRMRSDHVKTA